jgi:hypothetical protein
MLALAGPTWAQTGTKPGGATKMSRAECTSAWNRVDAAKSGSVTEAQAHGVVTSFKSADVNNDGKLTQAEFVAACDKGLVSASAGTGTGARGLTGTDGKPGGPGAGGSDKK